MQFKSREREKPFTWHYVETHGRVQSVCQGFTSHLSWSRSCSSRSSLNSSASWPSSRVKGASWLAQCLVGNPSRDELYDRFCDKCFIDLSKPQTSNGDLRVAVLLGKSKQLANYQPWQYVRLSRHQLSSFCWKALPATIYLLWSAIVSGSEWCMF